MSTELYEVNVLTINYRHKGNLKKSEWVVPVNKCPIADVYGTNDYLKLPEFNMYNILIHSPNECQMIDNETEVVRNFNQPDFSDKYGYVQS